MESVSHIGPQGEAMTLTHGGVALDELEEEGALGERDWSDDEGEDEGLGEHSFGGGLLKRREGAERSEGEEEGRHKTHKEIMEEIIAKSKVTTRGACCAQGDHTGDHHQEQAR